MLRFLLVAGAASVGAVVEFAVSGGRFLEPYYTISPNPIGFKFQPGESYVFNAGAFGISANHPFAIGAARNVEPTFVVSKNHPDGGAGGMSGSSGSISFTIPADYKGTLAYYCKFHSSMVQSLEVAAVAVVTPSPTPRPTPNPTPNPTPRPTPRPTADPTKNPTPRPTPRPTSVPTHSPTHDPTSIPTPKPSFAGTTPRPTADPTANPTHSPTHDPTHSPSHDPTHSPTHNPTSVPTPKPSFATTPGPTPPTVVIDVCADSATWFKSGQPKKPCDWVARKPDKRCEKSDPDDVLGAVACPVACNTCDSDNDAVCDDSPTWFKDGQPKKPCEWVAFNAKERCNKSDADGVKASVGCPAACGTCAGAKDDDAAGDDAVCADSATWFKSGQPKKPCDWVARKPDKRCEKSDPDDVLGAVACPVACNTCDSDNDAVCDDSPTWFKDGQPKKPCEWVAFNAKERCNKSDADGVKASVGCPAACGTCAGAKDDAVCADSATWLKGGQPEKPCDWVAGNTGKRCQKEDAGGVEAFVGCPVTCGTC